MGGDAVMLTEEEAKKKWCPFARMAVLDSGPMVAGFNRRNDSGWDDCGGVNCIASECMAWRWKELPGETQTLPVGSEPEPNARERGWTTPTTTALSGHVVWYRKPTSERGYCGLAGKP